MQEGITFICFITDPKTGLLKIHGVSTRIEQVEEFMAKDDNSCRSVEAFVNNKFGEFPEIGMQIMIDELNKGRNY